MNARKAVDREWNETIKPMLRSLNVGSYRYSGLPAYTGFSPFSAAPRRVRREAHATRKTLDDAAGDATYFIQPGKAASMGALLGLRRYGSLTRRKAW